MTDKDLVVSQPADLATMDFDAITPIAQPRTDRPIPSLTLVQALSESVANGLARPGEWLLNYGDVLRPSVGLSRVRVWWLDGPFNSRVYYTLDEQGKFVSGAKTPLCGSPDGDAPRDKYIGETLPDWRTGQSHVIGDSCADCPLGQWITEVEEDEDGNPILNAKGKRVARKDKDGKVIRHAPPCSPNPRWVVYLIDHGLIAVVRARAYTVRMRLEGRNGQGIPGLTDYFQPIGVDRNTGRNIYPFMKDGKAYPLVLSAAKHEKAATMVPKLELDVQPITIDDYRQIEAARQFYVDNDIKGRLLNLAFSEDDFFNDEDAAPSDSAPQSDAATTERVRQHLGSGGGKRRVGGSKPAVSDDPDEDAY